MKISKPIIGVTPSVNDDITEMRLPLTYMEAVKQGGGVPFLLPLLDNEDDILNILDKCDGVLLSGGVDVDPVFFGEEKLNDAVEICDCRDNFEMKLARLALLRNMPIMGICRGIQVLNVALGGTLYQDIPSQLPESNVNHRGQGVYPAGAHNITIENAPQNPVFSVYGCERALVNTYHHQSVKKLGKGLKTGAVSDDGIIEAVYLESNPNIFGVQWHPEKLFDEPCKKLFESWINNIKQMKGV